MFGYFCSFWSTVCMEAILVCASLLVLELQLWATFPGHYVPKSNHSHGCSQGPKSKMFCVSQKVLPGPSITHICTVENGIMTNISNMSTGSLLPDSPSSVPKVLCKGNGLESVSLYASAFQIDCSYEFSSESHPMPCLTLILQLKHNRKKKSISGSQQFKHNCCKSM